MSSSPGHPHRCRAGHRWQHTGPTALTCNISAHESGSGDLPFVAAQDCPLCSGREDLLVRELHSHYCNLCEGDWEHDGRCLEGLVAFCPWCFPDVEPASTPGARLGAHFHFCPECTQNWRHQTPCAAPLRAALADCPGCRAVPETGDDATSVRDHAVSGARDLDEPDTSDSRDEAPSARWRPPGVHVAAPTASATRATSDLVGPAIVPLSLVAAVILAIPVVLTAAWILWGAVLGRGALLSEAPPATDSSRRVARPATRPEIREPEIVEPPRKADEPRVPIAGQSGRPRDNEARERQPEPKRADSIETQRRTQREGERRVAERVPETPVARAPDVREPEAPPRATPPPPTAPRTSAPAETPVAPSAPSGALTPLEQSPRPRPPVDTPPPNEGLPPATARVEPSIRGALGPSSGGATLETLPQSPSPVASRPSWEAAAPVDPPSSRELPPWSSVSPRWDRASVAETMRAVVDIRPASRPATAPDGQPRAHRGFIFDRQGYIVTSDQSIGSAGTFEVTLHDGRVLGATVVARDRLNDVAVLKVERSGLPAMALGDSGALAVGQRVLGIGNDGGGERRPVVGTVLATGAGSGGHMAVDLPPGPESVGSPLLNQRGHAVGIVTESAPATDGRRALTFAVPIDRIKSILGTPTSRPIAGAEQADGR